MNFENESGITVNELADCIECLQIFLLVAFTKFFQFPPSLEHQ